MSIECLPEDMLDQKRSSDHGHCFACGPQAEPGLHLCCRTDAEGRAVATFRPRPWMISYTGRLHGGLIATLLDSAMTQCLFAHGVSAVTAQLEVRYLHPVPADRPLTVSGWIEEHRHTLYCMRATLKDGERVLARAEARFVALPDCPAQETRR